jgi:acyl-CoA synthetase (AMP-forming)/AMP-acid ligase II
MVENAVYQHPSVQECAAVAFPCSKLGERVAVVIQPRPGSSALPSEREIAEIAAKHLPKVSQASFRILHCELTLLLVPSSSHDQSTFGYAEKSCRTTLQAKS